ncbi:MAG: hypothetical protein ACXVH3_15195, partial [Solirubrobacteraceae bacterium]
RVMSIRVRVDASDNQRVLLRHAVHAVLSVREGGLVGKGGQNSDKALVASRFLSGHAARPDHPYGAINGGQPRADRSQQDTRRVSLTVSQTPSRTPILIFTV